jgi:hypothetical protein
MHDIDRAMFEVGESEQETETEVFENEDFLGVLSSILEREGYPSSAQTSGEYELAEGHEIQLANEMLELSSEEELEQFLADLARRAMGAVGGFVRSDVGQAIGSGLRQVAKQALPSIGRAVGNWVVPGTGGDIGASLATTAGDAFGLELEGLSQEDREFEAARAFVRFAHGAGVAGGDAPPQAPPDPVAKAALITSARQYAPGLLPYLDDYPRGRGGRGGRWVRRGRAIVINDL